MVGEDEGRGKAAGNQKDQAKGAGAVPGTGVHNRNGVHTWAVYVPCCAGCEEL